MSADPQHSALDLAGQAGAALERGDREGAAALAADAAAAFLAEQGEPSFDAPNMLRMRAEALLALGEHAEALRTLDRADDLAEALTFARRAAGVLAGGAVTEDHPHLVASRERLAELAHGAT